MMKTPNNIIPRLYPIKKKRGMEGLANFLR